MYNNLNDTCEQILQPVDLNIELMEHQKTAVYAMKDIENKLYIMADNITYYTLIPHSFKIDTTIGILGDKVGSGKSYMIISLLLEQKNPPDKEQLFESTSYLTVKSNSVYKKINITLLIVPDKIIGQWKTYFSKAPTLSKYVCSTVNDITDLCNDKLDLDNDRYDVIIIACSKFKLFDEKFRNIKWSRIIIDEADTIKLNKKISLNTSFLWLVTGTPNGLLYMTKPPLNGILKEIKPWIFEHIIIKNNNEYLEKSIILPVPKRVVINCKTPKELEVIKSFVPKSIIQMINAGNTDSAIKFLNCNVNTNENILQVVTKKIRMAINNQEKEIEIEKHKKYKPLEKEEQEKRIKQIEHKINRLTTRYDAIKEKIYGLNTQICPICMSDFTRPVILNCCKNIFCFECIAMSIEKLHNRCPYCKKTIYKSDLNVISTSKNDKESLCINEHKRQKDKLDQLMEIINSLLFKKDKTDNHKILIFANYEETFKKIETKLYEAKINYNMLKGTTKQIELIINNFTTGKIKIIMLNAKYFGAGMNLHMATDLIIYHRFNREMEEQIIGRAQRIGRVSPLTVYYLVHANEDMQVKTDDTFEELNYVEWLEKQTS